MGEETRLTVWLLTYDRIESVFVALASLLGQTYTNFYVHIMVDNTYDVYFRLKTHTVFDALKTALRVRGIEIELFYSGKQGGICLAKNVLLNTTKTEYFLYLEDDGWLSPNYIERLMTIADSFREEKIGGIAGVQQITYISPGEVGFDNFSLGRKHYSIEGLANALEIKDDEVIYKNKAQVYRYFDSQKDYVVEAQCFIHTYMLKTEAVREIGGWDLQFNKPPFAFEEIDVTYGLHVKGYRLLLSLGAEMYHLRSSAARIAMTKEERINKYKELEQLFINKYKGE